MTAHAVPTSPPPKRLRPRPLANRLRQFRQARGLTQVALGRLTGLPQTEISKFERGRLPTLPKAAILAQALGCRIDDLFSGAA